MKTKVFLTLCSVLVVLVMAAPPLPAQAPSQPPATPAKTWDLVYASYVAENWIAHDLAKIWDQEMRKRTGGRVKIGKWLFGGSLLKMDQMTKGIGSRMADIGYLNMTLEPSLWPLLTTGDLIYLTDACGAKDYAYLQLYDTYAPVKAEFDKNNLFPLFLEGATPTVLAGKGKHVKTLEDLKGRKFRSYGMTNDVLAALGATPLVISTGDLYSALDKGIVDGYAALVASAVVSLGFLDVTEWIDDPGIGVYVSDGSFINLDVWKSFPPDIQKIALDLRQELLAKGIQMFYQLSLDSMKKCVAKGATLYVLPNAEKARWRAKVNPEQTLWPAWINQREKQGVPAKEYLDRLRKLLPETTKKSTYPGNDLVFREAMGQK